MSGRCLQVGLQAALLGDGWVQLQGGSSWKWAVVQPEPAIAVLRVPRPSGPSVQPCLPRMQQQSAVSGLPAHTDKYVLAPHPL